MARDIFHETVKKALEKDGWTITHDPFYLNDKIKNIKYEIDLGAEKLLAAERNSEKIAVEIKSFTKISFRHEFHAVLGQYLIYYKGLYQIEPERQLFLAMPSFAYNRLQTHPFLLEIVEDYKVKLIIFDDQNETLVLWKK
jgi:ferric iron reductase protein FhuF